MLRAKVLTLVVAVATCLAVVGTADAAKVKGGAVATVVDVGDGGPSVYVHPYYSWLTCGPSYAQANTLYWWNVKVGGDPLTWGCRPWGWELLTL